MLSGHRLIRRKIRSYGSRANTAASIALLLASQAVAGADSWTKHRIHSGFHTNTAVAAEFTGDGRIDVIASGGGRIRLLAAPDWRESAIYAFPGNRLSCIHSTAFDVDGDGDPDYLGAPAKGPVFWLENPDRPEHESWNYRVIDDQFDGIHCLLAGDVDLDGVLDLIVNNFTPDGPFADSIAWLTVPANPRARDAVWDRQVFAKGDAPGGNHYMGLGDLDGDGLPDIACGAKGDPFINGNWFAWWKNPGRPDAAWQKFLVSENETGATNLLPADLNGDGRTDLFASRGHGKGVLWFESRENGWKAHDIHTGLEGPHCLAVADFDEDGDIDGATCAKDSKLVMWYENDGSGSFTNHQIGADQAAYDIRAVDMDGDTDLDLLVAGQQSANVVWYENPLKEGLYLPPAPAISPDKPTPEIIPKSFFKRSP